MRANILFCLYFFMGLAVQLQAQVTVTGKVIDEQQQPVPYANIVLLSLPDSAFVAGSISNEEGACQRNKGCASHLIYWLCYCLSSIR
jgi:hypothetical protein